MTRVPALIADQHAAMARCAMLSGEKEKAISAIRVAFDRAALEASDLPSDACLETITDPRTAGILAVNGIFTVADLIEYSTDELLAMPQIGTTAVAQLQSELGYHGLKLVSPVNGDSL